MNVLSIQSHVTFGHVGNAAAVFALQRLGHVVWPIHTVNLATHTGFGPPTGTVADAETLRQIGDRLDSLGVLNRCDAVLTGYLGTPPVAEAVGEIVQTVRDRNKNAIWCCDPVMGDVDRGLFVDPGVAAFFSRHAGNADILIPNAFELSRLTGHGDIAAAGLPATCDTLFDRGVKLVVATSLAGVGPNGISTAAATPDRAWQVTVPAVPMAARPDGAGDLFAAVYLGVYLDAGKPEVALAHAAATVRNVLQTTASTDAGELCVVEAQNAIAAPAPMPSAEII